MKKTECNEAMLADQYTGGSLTTCVANWLIKRIGGWRLYCVAACFITPLISMPNAVLAATMENISFSVLAGDRIQLKIDLSEPPPSEPLSFTIDDPARIAVDFPDISLGDVERSQAIDVGVARSVSAVEAAGRTRIVLELLRLVPYELSVEGNAVMVLLDAKESSSTASTTAEVPAGLIDTQTLDGGIEGIDFKRGDNGEGRIIVTLSDSSISADIDQVGGKIVIDFVGTELPEALNRRLDVVDFATPVKEIDTRSGERGVHMEITTVTENYDYFAYQADKNFVVEIQPLSKEQAQERKRKVFTGERLSLNFQDIEVRAVLQLLGDFTGLNMVASDTVTGNVTLRLKNVPWDQALDIILKAKGLSIREVGNVIMVAPTEEIAAREKLELEASQQVEELAPLRTEFIQVNYAKAEELAALIKAEENNLLTERGSVTIDSRTNTLIVQDIATSLQSVREMVDKLDIAVRQVLIESRIVNAEENFAKDIGVRFGYGRQIGGEDDGLETTIGANAVDSDGAEDSARLDGLIVSLPAAPADATAAALGFAIGKIGSWLLQLELSALIAEDRVEDIANPKVITTNQSPAMIESGVEIPYQEASSSGATSVSFKKAVLSLEVTPQITPDDRVLLDLSINQDSRGVEAGGIPSINTRNVTTQVMVENGETVVLGGIFTDETRKDINKVPFLGDLPYVGFLFRQTRDIKNKRELLIFITPKILKDDLRNI